MTSVDPLQQQDAAALAHFGFTPDQANAAAWVEVPGVVEATCAITFDVPGVGPVVIVGRHGGRLGTLASPDSTVVRARPHLWVPLRLGLAFAAEEKPARR